MNNISKKDVKTGLIWSAIDSLGTQVVSLIINLILARLLGPSIFGLVALLSVFTAIGNVFVNSGFSQALIRKTERTEADFSTTFYFSLTVSIVSYLFFVSVSPAISSFYNEPELNSLTKYILLTIVINSLGTVPRVKLTVELNFKLQTLCSLISLFLSGLTAFILAYLDYGVWALISFQITLASINVMLLNILVPSLPKTKFSRKSFRELFGFGSKLLVSGLIDTVYRNVYSIIIGKQFSSVQLGLFNQAEKISSLPAITLASIIQKVSYPTLSRIKDNKVRLESSYLLVIRLTALVILPIILSISIIAEPLVRVLLGKDWILAANYIEIITVAFVLYPLHAINLSLVQVKGRSDLFLKIEIIKKISLSIILCVTVPMGIEAMCYGMVLNSIMAFFINTSYVGRLSSLGTYKQLRTIVPYIFVSFVVAIYVMNVGDLFESDFLLIVSKLVVYFSLYISTIWIIERKFLSDVISHIK
ncbi:lipopolysaccharide biosynthesis protein [Vibrio sp. ECSMB14106]|uniref:lipopolysaccharide biosynthesis protein n=1 Tax=Vibrio sp. ECSMB14106 TaxID=1638949 RepID=UPI000AE11387|nr:lipopolysaccharide biosynthesis protein [Vibrio sp. ECSMB14106]